MKGTVERAREQRSWLVSALPCCSIRDARERGIPEEPREVQSEHRQVCYIHD